MSLSSYFNSPPVGIGTVDLSGYFNSYFNNNSSNNNQNQKPFQNQYYQDALKNPDNYTWGVWDANKPMSSDNWQPKPRQAGDARDPNSSNYQQPMTYSSTVTGTGHVKSTSNNSNDSNNNKSNGSINASNDNWTLPTYNYDPNLTFGFLNAVQSNSYNPQNQQYLRDNNALKNEAASQDLAVQIAAKAQGNALANQQNWQNAQIDKWRNQPTSFSSSRILDPNSKEGWDYQTWQNINTNNQIRAQQPALDTQRQVQQIASTSNVDAARATAEAQRLAAQYQSDAARATAEAQRLATQYQSDVSKQIAQIGKDQALAAAQIAAQSQMYGANMGAMSSMFGSQMGAVGSMFGSMGGGGGGARYW